MSEPVPAVGGLDQFKGFFGGLGHAARLLKTRLAGKPGGDKLG